MLTELVRRFETMATRMYELMMIYRAIVWRCVKLLEECVWCRCVLDLVEPIINTDERWSKNNVNQEVSESQVIPLPQDRSDIWNNVVVLYLSDVRPLGVKIAWLRHTTNDHILKFVLYEFPSISEPGSSSGIELRKIYHYWYTLSIRHYGN